MSKRTKPAIAPTMRRSRQEPGRRHQYLVAGALLVLALAVRLLDLGLIRDNPYFTAPIMDEEYHHRWASDILEGRGGEYLPFYRAPGYPYLLAGAYKLAAAHVLVGRVLSAILGALTVVVTFGIGLLCGGTTAALLAAAALVFTPIALYYDGMLLGASLETLLFALGLLTLLKAMNAGERERVGWAALLGGIIGLATVTRPIMAVVLPVAAVFLLVQRPRQWSAAAIAGVAWVLPVALVTAANRLVGHEWVLVAWNGGINFFLGNNPAASGWSATAPELRPSWWLGYLDAIQIASRDLGHPATAREVSAYWYHRAFVFVTGDPQAWIGLLVRKCYLLLNSFEFSNNQSIQQFYTYSPLFRVPVLGYGVILSLAVPQLATRRIWRTPLSWFVVIYGLTVVAFFVTSRYRLPLIPLLLVLAAQTTVGVVHAVKCSRWGSVARLGTLAALAAIITTSDWAGIRDPNVAEQHYSLGNRYAQTGAFEQAVTEYEAAIRERPYHMGAWNNIGTVRIRQGRLSEAQRVLEQSLALQATADAYAWIGMIYFQEGRLDSARTALEHSLAMTKDNPEALYYLGSTAIAEGDTEGAIVAWEQALGLYPDPNLREHLLYALGKLYLRTGRDPARAAEYLGRVTAGFPDLEELRKLISAARSDTK